MLLPKLPLILAVSAITAGVSARSIAEDTVGDTEKKKFTLCSYFNPSGNSRSHICSPLPKAEAQKECDARLKAKGADGTCDCTDDQDYINGKCG